MRRALRSSLVLTVASLIMSGSSGLAAEGEQDTAATPVVATGPKPDVIVIMLDDLGYLPDDRVLERLPNIRRVFLRDGMRFTRAYNEIPLCCPARANLFSGQHSLRNGVVVNTWFGFDDTRTLATAMDEVGYHTIYVGKYMNDYDGSTVPPGWDKAHFDRGHLLKTPRFWRDGVVTRYKGRFYDDVTRTKAVGWLRKAPATRPVFQIVAPYAPHRHKDRCGDRGTTCTLTPAVMKRDRGAAACRGIRPFKPPSYTTSTARDPYPTRMPRAWSDGWPLQRTCESLLVIDRLVAQLERAQAERDRPVYLFLLSDNGMSWGQHGFPLKHVPWATRLPLYVNGPGISRKATRARVSIIDIPLTIADLAGARMPWADGRTFLPVLRGARTTHRSTILEQMPAPPERSGLRYRGWAAVREGRWRYIRWDDGTTELYDQRTDRWETRDRSRAKPGVVARLDARLDELLDASKG